MIRVLLSAAAVAALLAIGVWWPGVFLMIQVALWPPLWIRRIFRYVPGGWIMYLLDLCYLINMLLMALVIAPDSLWLTRDRLFCVVFAFANGPLIFAIPLWKNSLYLGSLDRMTSIFLHLAPALSTSCLIRSDPRWSDIASQVPYTTVLYDSLVIFLGHSVFLYSIYLIRPLIGFTGVGKVIFPLFPLN